MALRQHWNFAMYIASLPDNRWTKRFLKWNPPGRASVGRLRSIWDSKLQEFGRFIQFAPWTHVATNRQWSQLEDLFIQLALHRQCNVNAV